MGVSENLSHLSQPQTCGEQGLLHSVVAGGVAVRSAVAGGVAGRSAVAGGVAGRSAVAGGVAGRSAVTGGVAGRSAVAGGVAGRSAVAGGVAGRSAVAGGVAGRSAVAGGVAGRSAVTGGVAGRSARTVISMAALATSDFSLVRSSCTSFGTAPAAAAPSASISTEACMAHGRVLLRLEARHETVDNFLARGRGRGLGAVELVQHLDGGLGDVRPFARPVQRHELRHGTGGCGAQRAALHRGLHGVRPRAPSPRGTPRNR